MERTVAGLTFCSKQIQVFFYLFIFFFKELTLSAECEEVTVTGVMSKMPIYCIAKFSIALIYNK